MHMSLQGDCVNTLQRSSAFNVETEDKRRHSMLNTEICCINY